MRRVPALLITSGTIRMAQHVLVSSGLPSHLGPDLPQVEDANAVTMQVRVRFDYDSSARMSDSSGRPADVTPVMLLTKRM